MCCGEGEGGEGRSKPRMEIMDLETRGAVQLTAAVLRGAGGGGDEQAFSEEQGCLFLSSKTSRCKKGKLFIRHREKLKSVRNFRSLPVTDYSSWNTYKFHMYRDIRYRSKNKDSKIVLQFCSNFLPHLTSKPRANMSCNPSTVRY